MWGSSPSDVFAVGANETILHSTNGGASWNVQTFSQPGNFFGVWGTGTGDVFVVGSNGLILHSLFDGNPVLGPWMQMSSGTTEALRGIWGSSPADIFAVGDNGTILHSNTDGFTWTQQTSGTPQSLYGVWGSGPNDDTFAVGLNGAILHSNNDGASWQAQSSPTTQGLLGVWGSGPTDVTVVGENGTVLHSTAPEAPIQPDPVFAVAADNSLWEHTMTNPAVPTDGWALLSPAGTILSISSVTDGAGQADVFAVTADHHLWEHSAGGWAELSTGSFQQISAATNLSGNAVVFGVMTDNSLNEQNPANGTGLNVGWTPLSPAGTILSVSAVTNSLDVEFGAGGDVVFAVTANQNLWEHSPVLPGNGWTELSTGSFQQISAGVNRAGDAVVYGVVSGGGLYEQNPANGTGLNVGWTPLSGVGGAPTSFLSAAAAGPDQVFAIASNKQLWQNTAQAGPSQASTGSFASISGEETFGGGGEVFAVLSDGSLWEYGGNWAELATATQLDGVGLLSCAAPGT